MPCREGHAYLNVYSWVLPLSRLQLLALCDLFEDKCAGLTHQRKKSSSHPSSHFLANVQPQFGEQTQLAIPLSSTNKTLELLLHVGQFHEVHRVEVEVKKSLLVRTNRQSGELWQLPLTVPAPPERPASSI